MNVRQTAIMNLSAVSLKVDRMSGRRLQAIMHAFWSSYLKQFLITSFLLYLIDFYTIYFHRCTFWGPWTDPTSGKIHCAFWRVWQSLRILFCICSSMLAFCVSFIIFVLWRLMRKCWHYISLLSVTSQCTQWFVNRLCSCSLEVVCSRQSDFEFSFSSWKSHVTG